MKRSEAIVKLEWYINEQNAGNVVGEQILNFVQGTLGMLPPVYTTNDIDPSNPFLNDDKYEWESEE